MAVTGTQPGSCEPAADTLPLPLIVLQVKKSWIPLPGVFNDPDHATAPSMVLATMELATANQGGVAWTAPCAPARMTAPTAAIATTAPATATLASQDLTAVKKFVQMIVQGMVNAPPTTPAAAH